MAIDRVRVRQTSGVIGNATTTFYFAAATSTNISALNTFFTALKPYFATANTYAIDNTGDTIDEKTGELIGGWTAGTSTTVVGTGASINSILSGFLIDWRTGAVVDGHRPIGKTIIVPCSNGAMVNTGFIAATAQTAINTACVTFLSSTTGFLIWHRPKFDYTTKPPTQVRDGAAVNVVSGTCNIKPTVLRSRRD